MAATTIGTINFGLTAETGFFAESVSFDASAQEKWINDADGDPVAGAVFGMRASFSIEGAYNTSGSPTWTLGSNGAPANAPTWTAVFPSYSSGGRYVETGWGSSKGNESEEGRTISGSFFPFMTNS